MECAHHCGRYDAKGRFIHGVREILLKSLGLFLYAGRPYGDRNFHQLSGYKGIYTVHVTRDDCYKASFTIENGVARLRRVASHHRIDKNP